MVWKIILSLFAGATVCFGQNRAELPPGVELRDYTGWANCIFLNATETPVQVVVAPAVGGRIAHFSLNGDNILFENSGSLGKFLGEKNEDLLLGGYQCEPGPDLRNLPPHWRLLEGPQRWKLGAPFSAKVFSEPDLQMGVAIDKEFVLAGDTGELGIVQRLRNVSEKEISYCLTDRTLCKGGGYVLFQVNKKSRYKEGWAQLRETGGKRFYDGEHPNSPDVRVIDGMLVAQTGAFSTRLGADSDGGWIAYARGKLLFVKYFPYAPRAEYSDNGNTVEIYFDRRATELDVVSPETKLAAGGNYVFPEKWVLIALDKEIASPEEARKLARRIPASPF